MFINSIGNNNQSFGAKLSVKEAEKFIPSEILKQWQNQAAHIGTDSDEITLNIGKLEDKPIVRKNYLGHEMNASLKGRSIEAEANINGKITRKDLTSAAYPSSFVTDRINSKVGKFLNELI